MSATRTERPAKHLDKSEKHLHKPSGYGCIRLELKILGVHVRVRVRAHARALTAGPLGDCYTFSRHDFFVTYAVLFVAAQGALGGLSN